MSFLDKKMRVASIHQCMNCNSHRKYGDGPTEGAELTTIYKLFCETCDRVTDHRFWVDSLNPQPETRIPIRRPYFIGVTIPHPRAEFYGRIFRDRQEDVAV